MLAHEVLESLQASGVAIAIEDGDRVVCRARAGDSAPELGAFLDDNAGISGQCIRERTSFLVRDTEFDSRVNSEASRSLGIRSLAVAPLHRKSQTVGIVEVFSDFPGFFDETSLGQLEACATRAAAIWASEERLHPVRRQPSEARPSSDAKTEETAISLTAPDDLSGSANPEREETGVNLSPKKKIAFPERALAHNAQRSSRWKWTGLVATVIPVILVGFSYRAPTLMSLVRAIGNSQLSSTTAQPKGVSSSSENSVTPPIPEQVITNSASLDPKTASPNSAKNNANAEDKRKDNAVENAAVRVPDLAPPASTVIERARSGDADAQLALADQYAHAEGAERDLVRAASWYIVAGIAGNPQAKQRATELTVRLSASEIAQIRFRVGEMLRDGIGVPPDLGVAYSWFVLAQAAGDARADREEKKLATVMKPSEIADARTHAANWIAGRK